MRRKRTVNVGSVADCPEYLLQMAIQGQFERLPKDVWRVLGNISPRERGTFFRDHFSSLLLSEEAQLEQAIRSVDPLNLIALLTNVARLKIEGFEPARRIGQAHVEMAQFLTLRSEPPHSAAKPDLETYTRISRLLQEYQLHAALCRSPALDADTPDPELRRRRIAYVTASYFSATRTWAYPQHVQAVFAELVGPLEVSLQNCLGYQLTTLFRMWKGVRGVIFQRLEALRRTRSAIHHSSAHGVREAIRSATRAGLSGMVDSLYDQENADARQAYLNCRVKELYTFSVEELHRLAGDSDLSPAVLSLYLRAHCVALGGLPGDSLEEALLDNPVWMRPLIPVAEERYFVALPELFETFAFRHVEAAFAQAGLEEKYDKARGRFLEEKVATVLTAALPSAQVVQGTKFHHNGIDGENDILVQAGNWLIVVEAKANKLTSPAQQGRYKRLQTKIQELVIKPSQQSQKFADYLLSHHGICQLHSHGGQVSHVDMRNIRRLLRIAVTLEPIGALAAQAEVIRFMNLVPDDFRFALTFNLFDLMVVMEVLKTEEERLDYLFRRIDNQAWASVPVEGEERDLLMFYLTGNLRYEGPLDQGVLKTTGWRSHLDDFYLRPLEGRRASRVVRGYTPLWQRLIAFIRKQHDSYWPESLTWLLTFTEKEQATFERDIRLAAKGRDQVISRDVSARGWKERSLVCMMACSREAATSTMETLKSQVREQLDVRQADQALVILLQKGLRLAPIDIAVLTRRHSASWI